MLYPKAMRSQISKKQADFDGKEIEKAWKCCNIQEW